MNLLKWIYSVFFKQEKETRIKERLRQRLNYENKIPLAWKYLSSSTEVDFSLIFSSLEASFFPKKHLTMPKAKKTLVLDLDETLVHSTSRSTKNYDNIIEVFLERHSCLYYVFKRPYLDAFLSKVTEWFHVVVYTASLQEYASPVIDWIDPLKKIKNRFYRNHCIDKGGIHLKDLSIVHQNLARVCLLDNSPACYSLYPNNAIPISPWFGNQDDTQLLDLLPFLDALRFVDDVRSILSLRLYAPSK